MPMNTTVSSPVFYYITMSEKLSEGIFYTNETGAGENVQYPLLSGSENNNAVWNFNKSDKRTEYWIFTYGSVQIDLCHGAVSHLCSNPGCSGPDNVQINISNAKWSSSRINNENYPTLSEAKSFLIGFDSENKVDRNVETNTTTYLRYWLTIPPNTSALNYNTTYQIRAVLAGENCV
jgi:hypothetical protein